MAAPGDTYGLTGQMGKCSVKVRDLSHLPQLCGGKDRLSPVRAHVSVTSPVWNSQETQRQWHCVEDSYLVGLTGIAVGSAHLSFVYRPAAGWDTSRGQSMVLMTDFFRKL